MVPLVYAKIPLMRTVSYMFMPEFNIATLIGALLGAVAGIPLAFFASRRSVAQPLDFDVDREFLAVAWMLQNPINIVKVLELEPEYFADRALGEFWAHIKSECIDVPRLGPDADIAAQSEAATHVPERLYDILLEAHSGLILKLKALNIDEEAAISAAQYIYDSGRDRVTYPGNSLVEVGNPGEAPLVRRYRAPRLGRLFVSSLLGSASGAVTPMLSAQLWPSGVSYWLSVASLSILSLGSIIWALVDHDTMLIDLETFFPLAGLAWVLALAADIVGGEPRRALSGFLLSIGIALFFRFINSLYRRYKKASTGVAVDGLGGGDSWLVIATAGVPAALAGNANLWYLCAMSGMFAAISVWLVRWPTPWRISRNTPFAFGPYLALGWVLGSAAYLSGFQII